MFKYFAIISILLYSYVSFGQVVTVPLSTNPEIKNYSKELIPKKKRGDESLYLPFFDDFSDSYVYPKEELWMDKNVFINSNGNSLLTKYLPLSIGVATFDALDKNGDLYANAVYQNPYVADTLTSLPLNLDPTDANNQPFNPASIFLSFYYQPQGGGDMPEEKDSLRLEFYSPQFDEWKTVWAKEGSPVSSYEQVIIQVSGERYLQDKFQFRFTNIVTLSDNSKPGMVSNCDFWNIDYVYIDKDRTADDLIHHDIAFRYQPVSFLNEYEAMPWTHFKQNPATHIKNDNLFYIKNNDNIKRLIDARTLTITDSRNGNEQFFDVGAVNINDNNDYHETFTPADFNTLYQFDSPFEDYAEFEIKAKLETDDYDTPSNNMVTYNQAFYNFYAYDDGTAEMGWGLDGEGTKNGFVAYKFTNYNTEDNLIGINMFFNRVLYDVNDNNYFILKVWEDDAGKPGNLIYEQFGLIPLYDDQLNRYITYEFEEETIVPESYYIGWEKTKTRMLNIGYDTDRRASDKIFYNITGEWIQYDEEQQGALMLRPVFGSFTNQPVSAIELELTDFSIYPNPATDYVRIQMSNDISDDAFINIFDINGKLCKTVDANQMQIDVGSIPNGVYFIELKSSEKHYNRKKLVILR